VRNKRIGILTGGGDVSPLNSVLSAAQKASFEQGIELIGFIKGWQGFVENKFVPLSSLSFDPLIGGTILKSARINLEKVANGIEKGRENFKKLELDGLIVIGGEDTLSNCFFLRELPLVLISKTIDNDVGIIPENGQVKPEEITNYFTLGFPTAAGKISSFVSLREGLRTTAYSHERLIVVESMGMSAGWLALSSSMGHPDFIVIPEFPLIYEKFKAVLSECYRRQRHAIVVVAEGAKWEDGSFMSADDRGKDDFGHPRFKGAAEALSRRLKEDLKSEFEVRNINAVNPSYLYRSGRPCELDFQLATQLGRRAVELLHQGNNQALFLTIQRKGGEFVSHPYPLQNHNHMEALHRFVDQRFFDRACYSVTESGKSYLSAIIEEFPLIQAYGLEHFSPAP
jgi:6-phosphofructokinase